MSSDPKVSKSTAEMLTHVPLSLSEAHTAYYRMRAAQHYFGCQPEQLKDDQFRWLEATVASQLQMESKVLSSAEAMAVVVPDQLLRKTLAELEAQYTDVGSFLDDLARLDLSVSSLSDLLERQLRVELVLELVLEQQTATVEPVKTEQALSYYQSNPEKFIKPQRRQAWHLLITINPEYPENNRAAVLKRISKLYTKIGGNLKRFKQQAQQFSECPSALNGGEMGWIPQGHLYPEIDRVLFQLEAGQISAPIETELGLHLVMCSEIQAEQVLAFDQMEQSILQKLTELEQKKAQQRWMRSLP